ncbi:hypothetical protein OG2516_00889 [Oceanicola granulosus HTCC2516]|uniref:SMP-30/Gluconolactonase/LRE-like region domain-containing protein n=1 Tax=Oceanicola granulosus (strain ATCC BAA-861 / DSM 15982 / KCTC 12143 / HTCC2516) TaxID=314256 RepID=Q2CJ62_OCEGH|nr:SMP-30/gluconolactonase/LRE family protein [Oceanicola granulosus]EAR52738.1 hypothetical protein OG2516_00889 [Oceanicola granulosus HTCC2516]
MPRIAPEPLGTHRAGLGEGPVWRADVARLAWIDIRRARLHETDPASGETTWRALPGAPGAVSLTDGDALLLAIGQELLTLAPGAPAPQVVARLPEGAVGRFNDGKPDAMGRFWIGTADPDGGTRARLWRYAAGQRFAPMLDGVSMSNGLGWSGDGRAFYYADSPTTTIARFDFDMARGTLGPRRNHLVLPAGQLVDGLCVDAEGCVWLAVWGQSCVHRIAPDGRLAETIELPTPLVTSCAFGGEDLRTLFITTASDDPSDPLAGALFACVPGPRGLPPNRTLLHP